MASSGSEIYAAFIAAELKSESDRRDTVNTRAASAVTSATALVTLTLAVFGLLVGKNHSFPKCAQPFLITALVFLLSAGALAVAAGFPWRYKFVSAKTLEAMLNARRGDSEETARFTVTYCNAVAVVSLRSGTRVKTWLLLACGICQILAICALAATIWLVTA